MECQRAHRKETPRAIGLGSWKEDPMVQTWGSYWATLSAGWSATRKELDWVPDLEIPSDWVSVDRMAGHLADGLEPQMDPAMDTDWVTPLAGQSVEGMVDDLDDASVAMRVSVLARQRVGWLEKWSERSLENGRVQNWEVWMDGETDRNSVDSMVNEKVAVLVGEKVHGKVHWMAVPGDSR